MFGSGQMACHNCSCIEFQCLIAKAYKVNLNYMYFSLLAESFAKTCQALALHTNNTTQQPHPNLFLLLSPRFWKTLDQPIPGSFPKKDLGYEVVWCIASKMWKAIKRCRNNKNRIEQQHIQNSGF